MNVLKRLVMVTAALTGLGVPAVVAYAGPGGQLRIERAWYQGSEIGFLQPSVLSGDPNGGVLACFGLGPDMSAVNRPTRPLYVIFDDTATEDHCEGQPSTLRHDHVLSVAPGDSGYTGAWRLVLLVEATPGSIDLAAHPITSATQVQNAIDSGRLLDVTAALAPDGPVDMVAPVLGGQ